MKRVRILSVVFVFLFFVFMLAACSGTMMGMIQQNGETVSLQFKDNGFGSGRITTTLSDGETFQGKFVEASSSGFSTGFSTGGGSSFGTVALYSGNIDAVLFGDKGHTMKCKFRAADSSIGLPSGGVGMCQVSDGRVIDVQF